jgi:iron complex outermembrane receptor protein
VWGAAIAIKHDGEKVFDSGLTRKPGYRPGQPRRLAAGQPSRIEESLHETRHPGGPASPLRLTGPRRFHSPYGSSSSLARARVGGKDSIMRTFACIGVLAVLTASLTGVAFAQSDVTTSEATLDFVVTASRTAEEVASVPAQVTVITADDIAGSGATSVVQVLEQAAGVSFLQALAGPGTESVSMRGFGENSFGRVLVLVDGVRLNNPDMKPINWNSVALSDIDRIEVLEGGASVLYGNNAVAGVINIITKKGSGDARTSVSGSVGSLQTNSQQFSHHNSTDWGKFSLAVEHIGTAGYRDRQAAQTVNASARATMNLSDVLSLSAQAALADLGYQMPGGLTKTQFDADPTQAVNWADEGTERQYSGGLGLEWLPSEALQIELPLSYSYRDIHVDMASWSTYTDRAVQTAEARPKLTTELPAGGVPVRLVGGVDLYGAWLDMHSYSEVQRTTESNQFNVSELSAGPYLSAKADLLRNLSLTGGARYDTALISAVNKDKSVNDSIVHGAFVYDAGLSYRPLDGLKVYASYGTLFRYPFTDEQAQTSGWSAKFNVDLKPETGLNAEGGIGINLVDRLSFSANLYYMQLVDEIVWDSATSSNVNLDQTRRLGSSVKLAAKPCNFLGIDASYSFVDAVFAAGLNEGKHIPLVPAHSASASATFTLPAGLSLGPTVLYKSDAWQSGDNANVLAKVDSYIIYGAQARLDLRRDGRGIAILVAARNLLETHYAPLVFYGAYYPAEGRSVSVSVDYRY